MRAFVPVLLVLLLSLAGCSFLERSKNAATSPRPDTGEVPATEVLKALPRAIALDPTAIATIVSQLTYVILAGAGVIGAGAGAVALQVRSYKKLREEGIPTIEPTTTTGAAPPIVATKASA